MTMPPWQDYNIIKRIKLKYNNKGIITTTYTNFRFFVFLCLTVSRSTSSWELVYQFRLTYCERTHTWDSKMAKRKQSVKKKEKFWSNCWTGCNLNYFWEMDLLVRCSVFHLFLILLQWRWFYSRESLTKGQPVLQKNNESLQLKQLVYRYFVTEQFVETTTISTLHCRQSVKDYISAVSGDASQIYSWFQQVDRFCDVHHLNESTHCFRDQRVQC